MTSWVAQNMTEEEEASASPAVAWPPPETPKTALQSTEATRNGASGGPDLPIMSPWSSDRGVTVQVDG